MKRCYLLCQLDLQDTPICGNYEFSYSYHKRIVEKLMAEYRVNYPELEQVVFRIGTILGESGNNQDRKSVV